ncbi:hypothetical protein PM082_008357 [Marasmius tenuissimus]|nr:hypothetical protein PM082_008357 [Marasmius tenuissimus]
MPLLDIVLPLSLFWLLVHVLDIYLKRSRRAPLLPSNENHFRTPRYRHWNLSNTTLNLKRLHLTISTTRWNVTYDKFVEKLKHKHHARAKYWITAFYNVGVWIGVLGMVCAVGALVWISGTLFWDLAHRWFAIERQSSLRIQKRDMTVPPTTLTERSSSVFVTPIIPGLTVPLVHLPVIVLAVLVCQVFHELGHALGAALDYVPLLSVGASLTVAFPSAHVAFPPRYVETLPSFRRARIISAGPWHNIVMWLGLLAAGRTIRWVEKSTSVGSAVLGLVYEDISHTGRMVVAIEEDSPLRNYLTPGSTVTYLDDVPLGGSNDTWSAYLSGDEVDETLLWNGPKQEIWDQVTVSRWKPRIRFIPANAIFVVKSFLDYLVSASLSLFFFNLLPVSFLDGGHLLKAILNDLPDVRADDFDIESIDVRRFPGRWKARFESLVMYGTIGLLVVCMAMAVVRMITT